MEKIDLLTWMKRWFLWTAIIVTIVVAIVGLVGGSIIEETLTAEIAKYVVMDLALICIFCVFGVVLGQIAYHNRNKKKNA